MGTNKRSNKRRRLIGPVRYCCGNRSNGAAANGNLPDIGVVLNKSDSGLCFMSTCPLTVGQSLVVRCPWVSDRAERGTVRWCIKAASDLWRIGFQKSI